MLFCNTLFPSFFSWYLRKNNILIFSWWWILCNFYVSDFLRATKITEVSIRAWNERRRDIVTILFAVVYSTSVIQFSRRWIHFLYYLQYLTIFDALILRQIFPRTIFTWRTDHFPFLVPCFVSELQRPLISSFKIDNRVFKTSFRFSGRAFIIILAMIMTMSVYISYRIISPKFICSFII